MGANIIITEVDEPKTLTDLDELKTPKVGGGYEYWVRKSDTTLTTKSIAKNGTYNASSDNAYGYSKVTVNVAGGNGSADSHGKPNTNGGTKPGSSGSAVVGTNPDTGNEEVVGVDEDGNLVTTPIPSSIEIITPPTKTTYTEGETMDYSGIVVGLKNKDGTTFTDSRYMNGHIPMGELIFPVEVAPDAGGSGDQIYNVNNAGDFCGTITNGTQSRTYTKLHDGAAYATIIYYNYGGSRYTSVAVFSVIPSAVAVHVRGDDFETDVDQHTHTFEYNGTVYYACIAYGITLERTSEADTDINALVQPILQRIESGDISGQTDIPVKWVSPYNQEEMEDSFKIIVNEAQSGSHTTESSSGTEGSGGGGSF